MHGAATWRDIITPAADATVRASLVPMVMGWGGVPWCGGAYACQVMQRGPSLYGVCPQVVACRVASRRPTHQAAQVMGHCYPVPWCRASGTCTQRPPCHWDTVWRRHSYSAEASMYAAGAMPCVR